MEAKRVVTALLVDDDPASRKRNEESLKDRVIEIFEIDQGRSAKLTRRSTGARRILLAC